MKSLLLITSLLLATPVLAQDAAAAKKTFQALYNKEATAFMKKDLETALSINTANYTATDTKKKTVSLADLKAQFTQIMGLAETIKLSSTVEKVTVKGDTALVLVSDKSQFVLKNPQTGQKMTLEGTSRNEDTWVKQGGTWKRQKNRALANTSLRDGKPIAN